MPHKDKEVSNREKKNNKKRNGNDNRTGKYSQKHIRVKLELMDNDKNQVKESR